MRCLHRGRWPQLLRLHDDAFGRGGALLLRRLRRLGGRANNSSARPTAALVPNARPRPKGPAPGSARAAERRTDSSVESRSSGQGVTGPDPKSGTELPFVWSPCLKGCETATEPSPTEQALITICFVAQQCRDGGANLKALRLHPMYIWLLKTLRLPTYRYSVWPPSLSRYPD